MVNVKQLTKKRTPVRSLITRAAKEVSALLSSTNKLDIPALNSQKRRLQRLSADLTEIDEQIKAALVNDDTVTEESYLEEIEAMEQYMVTIEDTLASISETLRVEESVERSSVISNETDNSRTSEPRRKIKIKLPKFEIRKFSGEHLDWIGWWSHFSQIDENPDLSDKDKFDYLELAMTPKTRAADIVGRFPTSAANYPLAIKALKERYAKPKLLKQLYVRELLKLVVQNTKKKEKFDLVQHYDKLDAHIRALSTLGVNPEHTSEFLYPMVESSLPEDLLIVWQRSPYYNLEDDGNDGLPKKAELTYLMEFLEREANSETQRTLVRDGLNSSAKLGSDKSNTSSQSNTSNYKENKSSVPTAAGLVNGSKSVMIACTFCQAAHYTSKCRKSRFLSMDEKKELLRKSRTCFKCLRPNHRITDCVVPTECEECHEKTHLRPMCPNYKPTSVQPTPTQKSESNQQEASKKPATLNANTVCRKDILLKTLMVEVIGPKASRIVRLLFDDGSQLSNITSDLIRKIGAPVISSEWSRNMMFGGSVSEPRNVKSYKVQLRSMDDSFTGSFVLRETPVICGVVPRLEVGEWVTDLKKQGIELFDVNSPDTSENQTIISVQIGSDYWSSLVISAPRNFDNGLSALNTKLGWTVSGPVPLSSDVTTCMNIDIPISLQCFQRSRICELWELEALGIKPDSSDSVNDQIQQHFEDTVRRSADGRYVVELPWKGVPIDLPSNKAVALKRLMNVSKRLLNDKTFVIYDEMLSEWLRQGLIEEAVEKVGGVHYLPHRAVYRPGSSTTPVRPVFDGSCKVGKFKSVNDCLHKGPNLLDLLPAFLLRFREKQVAFTADIRRAFMMIELIERDREYLRFLWWEDYNTQVYRTLRHVRLVFGLNCSPYLLNAVLSYHFSKWPRNEETIDLLKISFYVDNLVGSISSRESFLQFKAEAIEILDDAKMELRQWHANCQPDDDTINILGISWNSRDDTLFLTKPEEPANFSNNITRRTLSSEIQKIFDPLGFVSATIILPKLWLQQSWQTTSGWDEPLADDVVHCIRRWFNELPILWSLRFERYLKLDQTSFELHVFCDASASGYACVVFSRLLFDTVELSLVQARTRLAPTSKLSIPRLELMGCWMGIQLLKSTIKSFVSSATRIILWTDSTTALSWITNGNDWSVFVQNRVKEIREGTPPIAEWRHVPGKMNPADLPSRGCYPSAFADSRWWEGPDWLKNEDNWPSVSYTADDDQVSRELRKAALKTTQLTVVNKTYDTWYLPRENFSTNVRIIAYVLRFVKRQAPSSRYVTREEYKRAECWILRQVQRDCFSDQSNLKVATVDNDGLLCVKTKLLKTELPISFKLPILLPADHPVVNQIILEDHRKGGHCGAGILRSRLRNRFWILSPRRAVKRVIKLCTICARWTSKRQEAPEGDLPLERVSTCKVFSTIGIDLAGPLYCLDGSKCWVVLFTCAVYRAVHLELVTSISTQAFLFAFRRFICRRGRPSTIFSDNGTNFEGADNYFRLVDWDIVVKTYASEPITWKFNPPAAPWWGGFWERLIRSVKDLLKRMIGKQKLQLSQIENMLFEIEALINMRPLTYISNDSDELEPLTPAHFLCEEVDLSLPEMDAEHLTANVARKKFKLLSQLRMELKQRFEKEYLSLLAHGQSKHGSAPNLRERDVVLVGSDDRKRLTWNVGRIISLSPGSDGVARLARVRTKTGEFLRPIQRLYPLELTTDEVPPISNVLVPSVMLMSGAENEIAKRSRYGRVLKKPSRFL